MFAKIPRNRSIRDNYQLTISQEALRKRNRDYYQEYLKEDAKKLTNYYNDMCKQASDYDITNPKKLLQTDFKMNNFKLENQVAIQRKPSFIPLTPNELNNITVTPFMIKLQGIVPDSCANAVLTIKNKNEFSIRVYVSPRKKGALGLPEGNRKIIKGKTQEDINIVYKGENVGKHYVVIDVIINESHGCECILQARVIPGFVTIDITYLEFLSNGNPRYFLKLTNPCNVDVPFVWKNNSESLTLKPLRGIVPAKCYMYCKILYQPVTTEDLASELIIALPEKKGPKILLDVFATMIKPKVGISTEHLELPLVPLNILTSRKIVMRNFGFENVVFTVNNPKPIFGVTITPSEGILYSFGDQTFYVNVQIPTCISFSCTVVIEVQKIHHIKFKISGCVEYPQIKVTPKAFNLRKVCVGSFDQFKFKVENIGRCISSIKFNFDYYPEFYIATESKKGAPALQTEGIMLEPKEQKILYLHFCAIDVAPNRFHLPIIINGILGPSIKMRNDTIATITYLGPGADLYSSEFATVTEYPEKLQYTEVNNTVSCAILEFSDLKLQFHKYPCRNSKFVDNTIFFVTNVSPEAVTFTILLKGGNNPFLIRHLEGGSVHTENNSLTITIASKIDALFSALFLPDSPGEYLEHFPIYLQNVEDVPYNYIEMHGYFYEPSIEVPKSIIYMLPVPLGVQCESLFTAKLRYHDVNCSIFGKSQSQGLVVSIYRENMERVGSGDEIDLLHVGVMYAANVATEYTTEVLLSCSCGVSVTFTVKGITEDCILTTHIYRNVYYGRDVWQSDLSTGIPITVFQSQLQFYK